MAQAGIILTIISLVSVISRVVTPILAETYGTRRMMAASLTIQAATVFMLFWAQDVWAFYLFAAVVKAKLYFLAVVGVLNSVVSLYYYVRPVRTMFFEKAPDDAPTIQLDRFDGGAIAR